MENYTNLLEKLIPELVRIFQGSITSIILYGSVARGTQTEESDIDIAVLVGSYTKEMHEQMTDLVVDLELEYDKVLSVLLIDYDKFTEWENGSYCIKGGLRYLLHYIG
ncbi:hypothetical protein B5G11_15880 [Drancourtella sp. An57]|uniref:nucleotidyltransferase domain-containing protein n=1 Tax=Drancourtella sp. An57 TaxID=1965647 RepID=UPI000B383865|nr:nucleotidyltransferase domain-containing protein [Drancourtella sp. An57]OUN67595.1 hypothetical protein B5G11_15880 [Drancourtella sp. An57]